jgi:hypothetical protein
MTRFKLEKLNKGAVFSFAQIRVIGLVLLCSESGDRSLI